MRAVARLVWTFFTATPLMRWFAAIGCVAFPAGIFAYLVPVFLPGLLPVSPASGLRRMPQWLQVTQEVLPFIGLLSLLAASARLPVIVERFALGRGIWLLPAGRMRLLLATVLAALLLALLTAAAATTAFHLYPVLHSRIFWRTLLMAFVDIGLIYAAIWLCGKTSGTWRLVGVFWMLLCLTIPLRYIGGIPPLSPLEGIGIAFWIVFAVLLLAGGRLRHSLAGWRARFETLRGALAPATPYRPGNEIDLLLGTSRPWIIAFGQIVPIAAMLVLIPPLNPWMIVAFVFLMLMSAVAGAITSKAAERSRRLWLRYDWTRDQLRRHVERAFWRYNAWSIGVLVLAFIGVGAWLGLPPGVIASGLTLIVAGGIASACLGLTITRGLGWLESAFCVLTIVVLLRATFATMLADFRTAIVAEILLVVLAIGFHLLARARWQRIDWMLCRPT